jgi:peptidoglycan/xylan/chitin deacetylase (PgdA/CDA1 family)
LTTWRHAILGVDYPHRSVLDSIAELIELDVNDYLKTERPYMTHDDVHRLLSQGFSVGAHSIDHPRFGVLSMGEQYRQIFESMATVEKWFHPRQRTFAFPFSADGVQPGFFERIDREGAIETFFGTGWSLPVPGRQFIDRIPMDSMELPAKTILKDVYSYNLVSRLGGRLRPQVATERMTAGESRNHVAACKEQEAEFPQ